MALNPKEKQCYQCGKMFIPAHASTLCCSDTCKTRRARELRHIQKEVHKKKGKNHYKKVEPTTKICIVCSKKFSTTVYRKLCCSNKCSKERERQKYRDSLDKKRMSSKPYRGSKKKEDEKTSNIPKQFLTRGKIHFEGYSTL